MLSKNEINLIKKISFIDFKLRYNSSVLGFVWSLLNPLLMLSVLYLVFSVLRRNQTDNFTVFLLLGIVSWNYFSVCTKQGMASIIGKTSLVKKMYINKEILVISSCITSLYGFLLNLFVYVIIMRITGVNFYYTNLFIILPLSSLFLLTLGISFFLSAIYSKFRDLNEIWAVTIRAGFFLAPIVYPIETIPEEYIKYYFLNPFSRILTELRALLITQSIPTFRFMFITLNMCIIILIVGYITFKLRETNMVEEL